MKKKKLEFSKVIMYSMDAVTLAVTAFTIYIVWKTENLDPLVYLIPASFGAFGVSAGFYYSKAKIENMIKLRKKYGAEIFRDVVEGDDYE